jgi:hypothetical protein
LVVLLPELRLVQSLSFGFAEYQRVDGGPEYAT